MVPPELIDEHPDSEDYDDDLSHEDDCDYWYLETGDVWPDGMPIWQLPTFKVDTLMSDFIEDIDSLDK